MAAINKALLLKIVILRRLRKRLKRKPRTCSIRPIFENRMSQGENILVKELRSDPHYHHRYFRMDKHNFDEILGLIQADIVGAKTHSRPISALEKLSITLRYIATGSSQVSLAFNYRINRMSPSSISVILRETLASIIKILGPIYLPPPTVDKWTKNEEIFRNKWNFPNACGAIDGKHIRINAPANSGFQHYNYKSFYSIILLAITGPNYEFTAVDIGASGSQSDGGVFSRSSIGRRLDAGTLGLPPPRSVGNKNLPHVLVADDAFPLKDQLLKPYPGRFLEVQKRIFNYRMSRARMTVENSFGILSARWRIFGSSILADLDLVQLIVHGAVILHNFLLSKKDMNSITVDSEVGGNRVDGNWRTTTASDSSLQEVAHQGSNNSKISAVKVRDSFKEYFNSEQGSVSWQMSRV